MRLLSGRLLLIWRLLVLRRIGRLSILRLIGLSVRLLGLPKRDLFREERNYRPDEPKDSEEQSCKNDRHKNDALRTYSEIKAAIDKASYYTSAETEQ